MNGDTVFHGRLALLLVVISSHFILTMSSSSNPSQLQDFLMPSNQNNQLVAMSNAQDGTKRDLLNIASMVELIVPLIGTNNFLDFNYFVCGQLNNQYSTTYFDAASQSCLQCPTGQVVDTKSVDGMGNYYKCKCPIGTVQVENDCSLVR